MPRRILAALRVVNGDLKEHHPTGEIKYETGTGIVSFPNPRRRSFVPIITDDNTDNVANDTDYYRTQYHFVRQISPPEQFRVWQTTLDTGSRNAAPDTFTAIVVAFWDSDKDDSDDS